MYPHERSLVKQLADKPFVLIGVNSDSDRDKIRKTVEEKDITWRSFWNGEQGTGGPISTKWGVTGWPTIYVLDEEGVIRYKNVRGEKMDRALETLLAEMGETVSISHEVASDDDAKASGEDEAKNADGGAKRAERKTGDAEAKSDSETADKTDGADDR
jgi:hypothetical protein